MSFLDAIENFIGSPALSSGQEGPPNPNAPTGLQNFLTKVTPLVNQISGAQDQQTMNNVFAANPDFAQKLYGAQDARQQVQNQSALTQLQQQEQQQKLQQQQLVNQTAQSVGGSPLEKLLALSDPSGLASYKLQQQQIALEQQRRAALAQSLPPPPGVLSAPNATAGADSGPAPLSVKNNNPGNMIDPKTGSFQSFDSPEEGIAAMTQDLTKKISGQSPVMIKQYGQGYAPTLTNILSTWAPPGQNNTAAYIQNVAAQTGIDPNQPLTVQDIGKIQPAMIKQEGGDAAVQHFGASPTDNTVSASADLPASTASSALQAPGSPQSSLQSPDAQAPPDPQQQALQGLYRNAQLDPEKFAAPYYDALAKYQQQATSVINPDNEALVGQGQAFINTIPNQDVKDKANAILEARVPLPAITSRTPANVRQAVEAAQAADPTLTAQTYPIRLKTREDFTTGPEAKNFNAINTVIQHLGEWNDAVSGLNNDGSQTLNSIANKTGSLMSDQVNGKVKAANLAAEAVSNEGAKAYKGTGSLSEGELNGFKDNLSANLGPAAQAAVTKQFGQLLLGKIQALNDQYASAFPTQPKNFLSPRAAQTLQKLGVDTSGLVGDSAIPDNQASVVEPASTGWSIKVKQ